MQTPMHGHHQIQVKLVSFLENYDLDFRNGDIKNPKKNSKNTKKKNSINLLFTLCTPIALCLYVVLRDMGGITAPVSSFASEPTCTARVPKPSICFFNPSV